MRDRERETGGERAGTARPRTDGTPRGLFSIDATTTGPRAKSRRWPLAHGSRRTVLRLFEAPFLVLTRAAPEPPLAVLTREAHPAWQTKFTNSFGERLSKNNLKKK